MTSPTPSTVLVTGATGGVGGHLLQRLSRDASFGGTHLIAGSRSGRDVAGCAGRVVDFADPAGLERAFDGVDALFLVFPLVPEKARLAANAVAAARAAGVGHVVRSSGAGADADSPVALARLQGEVDAAVVGSGLPTTLLRPNNFMQNFVSYYAGMVRGGTLYFPHGDARVSFVDVRDIADVAASVLRDSGVHAGRVYTLTGPEALGGADVARLVGEAIGRPVGYVAMPEEAAVASMTSSGMPAWNVEMMSSLNRVVAAGHAAAVSPDVERVTGRPPRRFVDFAREHVAAWT